MINKIIIFLKAQMSAFIGGVVDYLVMVFFTEVFHIHYTISIAIGGVIGAIVNFSINKKWTFHTKGVPYKSSLVKQFLKFVAVVVNSIVLKASGTYAITTYLGVDYKISRIITDLFVSLGFNYTLQKYWVFKKADKIEESVKKEL
jgi:putative flippase GtrA